MFKTMIITAAIGAAAAGGWWYGQSSVPTVAAAPQPAAVAAPQAPLTAPLPVVQPTTVLTCSAAPQAAQTAPQAVAAAPQATSTTGGLLSLNTAPLEQLDKVRWIGVGTLERIRKLREAGTPITLEMVRTMPGMTAEHWAEVSQHVTV